MKKRKYKTADTSQWPVISQEDYAKILTQIVAGLLASGHYTQELDLSSESPGNDSLLSERDYTEHYQSCVMEPARWLVYEILRNSGMNIPNLPDYWEEEDELESSSP